jgi:hypothetical protein
MRDLAVLFLHLLATLARLAGPGGARAVVAESVLVKQQLLVLNRSRKRSPNVDDWVMDFMKNSKQRLGLPADPAAWPKPQALQSIWDSHAYKMARIHLNVGEGRKVLGSDMYDAHARAI